MANTFSYGGRIVRVPNVQACLSLLKDIVRIQLKANEHRSGSLTVLV